jgi:type I site-specific restriction endonuclease
VKLSSKQLLLQKIQEQKQAEANDTSRAWWKSKLAQLGEMDVNVQVQELGNLLRNKRAEEELLKIEMLSYQMQLQVALWIQDPRPSSPESQDRFSLSIMRLVKQLVDGKALTSALKDTITTILSLFGFQEYTKSILKDVRILEGVSPTFKFKKLVKSKTGAPVYDFMVLKGDPVRWQLRLFGEFMDRSMDSAPDPRVPFHPDAWQRKVLDCIDANHSILVVGEYSSSLCSVERIKKLILLSTAPTSAGKTFISFYAMEQILRASDDDILVYVAPTKALVTQIAAEIYARFSKKMDASESFRLYCVDECLTMFEQSRAGPYTRGIIVSTTLRNVRSW